MIAKTLKVLIAELFGKYAGGDVDCPFALNDAFLHRRVATNFLHQVMKFKEDECANVVRMVNSFYNNR